MNPGKGLAAMAPGALIRWSIQEIRRIASEWPGAKYSPRISSHGQHGGERTRQPRDKRI
jgi:hypothetical protein